jgi:predicted enzyme related to lactoylglutathione lyase
VDEVVAAAQAAGARVTRAPAETFWGGYSGVFTDPDGHPWEVAHNPHWHVAADGSTYVAGPPQPAPGRIVYFAVPAPDAERAQAFYGGLFGWSFSGGNVPGGHQIEGADPPGGLSPEPGAAPRFWLAVDDIEAAADRVRELGGQAGEPVEIGSGWMLAAHDPNGVELNLWSGP